MTNYSQKSIEKHINLIHEKSIANHLDSNKKSI